MNPSFRTYETPTLNRYFTPNSYTIHVRTKNITKFLVKLIFKLIMFNIITLCMLSDAKITQLLLLHTHIYIDY